MRIKRNIRQCFGYIMFTWNSHAGLKFDFVQNDQCETHTVLSFISPQFMWTQVKSWLNTKVRFSTEMKSHNGLSSFCLSCERTLTIYLFLINKFIFFRYGNRIWFFFLFSKRVQILYSSHPIRLQVFFLVSDNRNYSTKSVIILPRINNFDI